MFANLYPFHQPKTAMQLSIIRPNTSFLVTCLANKTNHPVRSPSTCHAPPKNLPCTTTHRLHFYINQSCTTNKSTQKICHAPPLIEFISISNQSCTTTRIHCFQARQNPSIALGRLLLYYHYWCCGAKESKRLHLDKTLASFSTLGRARLYHLASFLNIAIIKTCFIQHPAQGITRESHMVPGLLNSQRAGHPEGNLTIQTAFHPKAYWQLSFTSQVSIMGGIAAQFYRKS